MAEIERGLTGVVLTETRLSMVDGQAGVLVIGGLPLKELAPNATFEEASYLLWNDRLPTAEELGTLKATLREMRPLPDSTASILRSAAEKNLSPMSALRMAVDTLSLDDPAPGDDSKMANHERAMQLVAVVPTIVAAYWRLKSGSDPVQPRPDLDHVANFLYMLQGQVPHHAAVRGLETYMNTVIDHGMNASTFTARVIISTRSDMISAIVGAIGALKGPLHGGAPGPALETVFQLRDRSRETGTPLGEVAESWARETISRGDRLMGFGHRVYKVRDPRADVLGAAAKRLFERTGDSALYQEATTVERVFLDVLADLKPGRQLSTNVEFYTALVLHGVGLDAPVFSSIFAMSRVAGWTAHVLEQQTEDVLIRPRARYAGARERRWIPIEDR